MISTKCLKASFIKSCFDIHNRSLHLSSTCCIRELRILRGEPANPNSRGPLTDLPDFSYLDGRPAPIGGHQWQRARRNRENAKKIVELISHVDFAKDRYQKMQLAKEEEEKRVLENQLKEKGNK